MSTLQLLCDSSLNTHVHFHVCVIDGVFEAFAGDESNAQPLNPQLIKFHPARINEAALNQMLVQVQASVHALAARLRPARALVPADVSLQAHIQRVAMTAVGR